MSQISIRLGLLRVERQLSQQQLADVVGVRRDTISALERGKSQGIEFSTLARLCDALGCTPNDILDVEPRAHVVPVLGGEDEDEIIAERLAGADFDAIAANPGLAGLGLFDDDTTPIPTRAALAGVVEGRRASGYFVARGMAVPEGAAYFAGQGDEILFYDQRGLLVGGRRVVVLLDSPQEAAETSSAVLHYIQRP